MQISGPFSPPMLQLRLPAQAMQGITLKPGELIQATVQQSDPSGSLTLEISGKLLQAISSLRLAAGITLQLRVEKTTDGIILHLDDAEQQRLMYQEALRRDLPRQESLRPLLQQLAQWQGNAKRTAQSTPTNTAQNPRNDTSSANAASTLLPDTLPKPIAQAIARLIAILPTLEKLSQPSALQQAIAHSGLFLESQLLSSIRPTELDHDLKAVLLRLAQNIRQQLASEAPQQQRAAKEVVQQGLQNLLRQIESGIARIQLSQLNALTSNRIDGETHLNLTLELPLYQPQSGEIEMLRIQIRRNGNKRKNGKDETWSVILNLSPQGYGEIHAVVSLGGGKISTTFWCEEETTAQLFREQLHQLQQRLTEQGVEIAQCSSRCGKPADGFTPTTNPYNGLIDTRA